VDPRVDTLPLVTLHLTERCNSRCVACDYWRSGSRDVSADSVAQLIPSLVELGTRTILVSGGEPLLHRQWVEIASLLRQSGLKLWLLTSGLSLAKHAARVAQLFQAVTVSLDGTDRQMYASIRGVDAFDIVCEGIRAAARAGVAPGVRVTVQRANYAALPEFVTLARQLGARQISFLAADLSNSSAFGRSNGFEADVALRPDDLGRFDEVLGALELDYETDFRSGFIDESPRKLRRLLDYYAAVCGLGDYPPVRCNAPQFSAVVGADGSVSPCFFIPGPPSSGVRGNLSAELNAAAMVDLREAIRAGRRPECRTCVCSLWRDAGEATDLIPAAANPLRRAARASATTARATLEAYEAWADTYAAEPHNPLMSAEQKVMVELFPDVRGRRALDLACGTGRYARLMTAAQAAEVVAIDFSPRMLRQVTAGARVLASMTQLPFANDTFDVVISGLALGHAIELDAWMSEVARVLRPGGTLLYSDFHPAASLSGLRRSFRDGANRHHAVPHCCHGLDAQQHAAAAAGLNVQVVRELRAGIEFREDFPGSHEFYRTRFGTPLVLVVRARRQVP